MNGLQPSTLDRLEKKLDRLNDAVAKLVLLEERQITQASRLGVVEKGLDDLEKAQHSADKKLDQLINRGIGVWMVVGGLFASVFAIGLKLLK